MQLNAYSVYDRKALHYHVPFFLSTDGEAIRSFGDLANDPNTTVGRHPMDYVLFHVGSYTDNDAGLVPKFPIRHVVDAHALLHAAAPLFPEANLDANIDSKITRPLKVVAGEQ